ncbi:unnamed protein product [Leuciscus chuanchicus]
MAVGFVSRQQQVSWHLMSPLNPTRLRIWQRDRETGEPADILDGTQKYTGKETRRARGGTKAEENCHCYEELWESAAESMHYSGTPRQVNTAPQKKINGEEAVFPPPVRTRFVLLDDDENPRLTAEAC